MIRSGTLPQAVSVLPAGAPWLFLALILVTVLPTLTGQPNACRSNGPQLRPLTEVVLNDTSIFYGKVFLDENRGYMFISTPGQVS